MPTFLETLQQTNGGNIWWLTFYLCVILLPISTCFIVAHKSIFDKSQISIIVKAKDSLNQSIKFSIIIIILFQIIYLTIHW